jgi:hypothetical protein
VHHCGSRAAADRKTISLEEHDCSYAIRVESVPLMSTRQHASRKCWQNFA